MEKNKKILIAFIVIIAIVAILFGVYKVISSYLFTTDTSIQNGKTELIQKIKEREEKKERKRKIDFSVEYNIITQEEANELY